MEATEEVSMFIEKTFMTQFQIFRAKQQVKNRWFESSTEELQRLQIEANTQPLIKDFEGGIHLAQISLHQQCLGLGTNRAWYEAFKVNTPSLVCFQTSLSAPSSLLYKAIYPIRQEHCTLTPTESSIYH
ncbi:unnamed protein product [Lupinus luteus]|uniref:Uncharacterized protein n=1 Tax=Lupinus luteus TaxID=3873 RepID=A0AAV1Y9M7_LUPLU